jgi:NAD(P)-dependent dehydrogenase (short-subunit alcohol dehydrogenase family)
VLITGAAGGVGAYLVERFLANGDTVVATDVSADALHALKEKLDAGDSLVTSAADITKQSVVDALAVDVPRCSATGALRFCEGETP